MSCFWTAAARNALRLRGVGFGRRPFLLALPRLKDLNPNSDKHQNRQDGDGSGEPYHRSGLLAALIYELTDSRVQRIGRVAARPFSKRN